MARIRHIVFHTTDVERLVKFYVEVMGLTIKHRSDNGGVALTDGYMDFSIHTNKIDVSVNGYEKLRPDRDMTKKVQTETV